MKLDKPLKLVIFMGSARDSLPPWGGTERLGTRVLKWVQSKLGERETKHEITVLDPIELKLEVLERPHFFYKKGEAPKELDELAATVKAADAYL